MLGELAQGVLQIFLEAIFTPEQLSVTHPYIDLTANHINILS